MKNFDHIAFYGKDDELIAALESVTDLEVIEIEAMNAFPSRLVFGALALFVVLDEVGQPDASTLQAFKHTYPSVPLIIAVRHASLKTAQLALAARAWSYIELGDSLDPVRAVLQTLATARTSDLLRWSRQRNFPHARDAATDAVENDYPAKLVATVISYIERHLEEPLMAKALAAKFSVDERTLLRYFKRVRGSSLRDFVKQRRVEEAENLLARSGLSVKEIAHRLGFSDAAHFIRIFREMKKATPGQFRREAA